MLIRNEENARQIKDFSGMQYGKMYPTDIDCILEYKNKAYIIVELKYGNARMPYGQQLALTRMAHDLTQSGKKVLCMIGEHNEPNPSIPIDVSKCKVREAYNVKKDRWIDYHGNVTVKELSDKFIDYIENNA